MSYQKKLVLLIAILALPHVALAGENRERRDPLDGDPGESLNRPSAVSDVERMDRFVIFNEKLKSAVCDESFISKAPTLDSITSADDRAVSEFAVALPKILLEQEVISFLLGDSLVGIYSEFVRKQVDDSLLARGLVQPVSARLVTGEQFLEMQAAVVAVKRRVSLDICEGLVDFNRLRQLLNARPSRFVEAVPLDKQVTGRARGFLAEVIDTGGRFGRFGERAGGMATSKYLIPGWLESFEINRVTVLNGQGLPQRSYRRIFNPVTNNTQSIELISREGVPLGILFVSREPSSQDWAFYRNWADLPEARVRQIETYRSRIEIDALHRIQGNAAAREQVRNLQDFYKNLLQAYQVFPNEKQFETYGRGTVKRQSLEEITKNILGNEFLDALRKARVNGSFVHVGLFNPDPKLHAIYSEYSGRLAKLGKK